jgi:hypothetical protein
VIRCVADRMWQVLCRRLAGNLERTRAGGSNVFLAEMYVDNLGKAIEYCESQNRLNGIADPEMCGADFSNLDEVAFDQGIDRIMVVCRRG